MQVLIVDSDDAALNFLDEVVTRMGYSPLRARDGAEAIDILSKTEVRLVITDWDLPKVNGPELCRAARRADLLGYTYVIMMTDAEQRDLRLEGLCAGVDDFLSKPLAAEDVLVCLNAAQRIMSLETRDLALFALAKLAESRDAVTGAHVERVQSYARAIGAALAPEVAARDHVDAEFLRLLHQTSPLHDIGKVGIPDAVLLKPDKLTAEEFEIMKAHTVIGAHTLNAALSRFPDSRFLEMARDIALSHHERYDGSGYPNGLAGDAIPLAGRIVAVADVYDSLSSRRVYKAGMSHEDAMAFIVERGGSHFDPDVVNAFLRAEDEILAVRERLTDQVDLAQSQIAKAAAAATENGAEAALAIAAPSKKSTILVVEDNAIVLKKIVSLLESTGEPVVTATDGLEALAAMEEHRPALVISDWEMPNLDGPELCRRLRAAPEHSHVHFIILTAHAEKGRILEAYDVGVDDFLSKPFDPEEFAVRVRAGLRTTKILSDASRRVAGSLAINAQLANVNRKLERLSVTDELTGLFNRRYGTSRLQEQWAQAKRDGRPLSVAIMDIDHFKKVNDTHGHDVGDLVLKRVSSVLQETTRAADTLCRYGGEEFMVVFSQGTSADAANGCERLRSAVQNKAGVTDPATVTPTISVGVATISPEMTDFTELLKAADEALYAAKKNGRNQVVVAETMPTDKPVAAPAQPAPIDFSVVLRRCNNDPRFAAAVALRFRNSVGAEIDKLDSALAAADAPLASRAARTLTSMLANMGANAAFELARTVEATASVGKLNPAAKVATQLRTSIAHAVEWLATHELPSPAPLARVA